jgi:hypothetical protein
MPLAATFLYYKSLELVGDEDDEFMVSLLPRLLPGFYISILGCLSLFCISFVIKHPHDVRTGNPQLREAVQQENRKYKAALKAKKKKRNNMKEQLEQLNGKISPQVRIRLQLHLQFLTSSRFSS